MSSLAPSLAIDARDVEKSFRSGFTGRRRTLALRGVSLTVPRGIIFGLLGSNGAGKSTLLSILSTLLTPDRGSVRVLGLDVVGEAAALRRRLNMASGRPSFLWSLRVAEIVAFYGRLYGLSGRTLERRVDSLISEYELEPYRRLPYNELSTGLKQRVALAKSLVNDPELLFLDEPTLGLDPDVSVRVRAHVAALRERGMTIVLTTHYMREAEELCDDVAFIKAGRILAHGTPDALKRQIKLGSVIALKLDPPTVPWLADADGVLRVTADADGWLECVVDDVEKRLPVLLRQLVGDGVVIRNLQVREPELEEVFVELAR
jgi:ABC-2 type transport system ATP-binding protein